MDSRLYFVLGDLASNVLVGMIVGALCALMIGVGWNMFLAMLITMAVGMLVGLVLWLPLGVLFGAMEVMLPTMFGGMLSGMVVGMRCTMMPVTSMEGAVIGGVCGLISIVFIWVLNNSVRGLRSYTVEGQ
jgi:hypothetical protein